MCLLLNSCEGSHVSLIRSGCSGVRGLQGSTHFANYSLNISLKRFFVKFTRRLGDQKERVCTHKHRTTHEPTAVAALVLRLAPPRLVAHILSPQVLSNDGAVRMNRFGLEYTWDNFVTSSMRQTQGVPGRCCDAWVGAAMEGRKRGGESPRLCGRSCSCVLQQHSPSDIKCQMSKRQPVFLNLLQIHTQS